MKRLATYEDVVGDRRRKVERGRQLARIAWPVAQADVDEFPPLAWSVDRLLEFARNLEEGVIAGRPHWIGLYRNIARQKQQWMDEHQGQSEVRR